MSRVKSTVFDLLFKRERGEEDDTRTHTFTHIYTLFLVENAIATLTVLFFPMCACIRAFVRMIQ